MTQISWKNDFLTCSYIGGQNFKRPYLCFYGLPGLSLKISLFCPNMSIAKFASIHFQGNFKKIKFLSLFSVKSLKKNVTRICLMQARPLEKKTHLIFTKGRLILAELFSKKIVFFRNFPKKYFFPILYFTAELSHFLGQKNQKNIFL